MPRINTRAVAKLQEAQKVLKKLGRNFDTSGGTAFAGELIAMLEKAKPFCLNVNGHSFTYRPDDVRVSKTSVYLGNVHIGLTTVVRDHDEEGGGFYLANGETENDDDIKLVLCEKEYAVAA